MVITRWASKVGRVSAGHGHSVWLSDLGHVFSAGRNDGGQLGVGDSIDRAGVQAVTGLY
ncbi:hypothetical protein T484DRAFT_1766821 [Baffinella frigidus]|nr:hypothetical protein T484DRAFT_1766821 [Cryptophyta sp. CCMP2293]